MQNVDIKKTLDWAEKNQDDPVAQSVISNYKKGVYNDQLQKAGMSPVKVQPRKINVQQAIDDVKMERAQQTIAPGVEKKIEDRTALQQTGRDILDIPKSLGEGMVGIGEAIEEDVIPGALKVFATPFKKEQGTRESVEGTKQFFTGLGRGIGSAVGGALGAVAPERLERSVEEMFTSATQAASEEEMVQSLVNWYDSLDPDTQLTLNTLGAVGEVGAELLTVGAAKGFTRYSQDTISKVRQTKPQLAESLENVNETVDVLDYADQRLERRIESAFEQGVKPLLSTRKTAGQDRSYKSDVQTAAKSIVANKQNLEFTDPETGEIVKGRAPETLSELRDALEQTKTGIFSQYDNLAKQAGESGLTVNSVQIGNSLEELINNRALQISNPEAVNYAQSVRDRFLQSGEIDAVTAQEIIKNYNNSLQAFYRNPTPDGLTKHAVDAYVVNQMRQLLDEGVEGLTGGQYQQLKNQYAALKTIERDVLRASLRDARRNQAGLIDFTDIFTIGQLASAVTNPANAIGAGASFGLKSYYRYLNNPNTQVKRMFQAAEKLPRDPFIIPVPTRKQLPEGQTGAGQSIYTPMRVSGDVEGTREVTRPGAVQRSDTEPTPTATESAILNDREAVQQAVSEMEAELGGDTRVSVGQNLVQSADGGYYRFNELPSWIPDDLRDGNLMGRVLRNIEEGKPPRANATNEQQLQELVQDRIAQRVAEIKNTDDAGVFSKDAAFAAALMAGGTYFVVNEDGEMLPVIGVASMMANPVTRRSALEQAKRAATKGKKLPESYKRQIAKTLEEYDTMPIRVKEDGVEKLSMEGADVDLRLEELKEKNQSGSFTDKDALEAEELLAKKGINLTPEQPRDKTGRYQSFNQSATTKTTDLLEEARPSETDMSSINPSKLPPRLKRQIERIRLTNPKLADEVQKGFNKVTKENLIDAMADIPDGIDPADVTGLSKEDLIYEFLDLAEAEFILDVAEMSGR